MSNENQHVRATTLDLDDHAAAVQLAGHIEQTGLQFPILEDEYRYASLPLCVIDAVFSIGVRYTSTQLVVERFCKHARWPRFADQRDKRGDGDHGLQDLLAIYEEIGVEKMAKSVYENQCLTSPKSGILKSRAVYLVCKELTKAGIDNFADLDHERITDLDHEKRELVKNFFTGVHGQSSGIAFNYFMMLAGDDNMVKSDRMVQRYVKHALSLDAIPKPRRAEILVQLATKELNRRGGQNWTPLILDNAIWKNQSGIAKAERCQ